MSDLALRGLVGTGAVADRASADAVVSVDHPKYRPDIDGLRAVAILSVVVFHAAPGRLPGGFIGVDIFFVISGFLISSIIVTGLQQKSFRFTEFYIRRIKRIFPGLSLVLFTCLLAGFFLLTDEELASLGKHIASGAGFVSNFTLWGEAGYFDNSADFKPLLHLWSLGIEEQFYIFWPLLLWFVCRRGSRYLALALAIVALSFALNLYQTGPNPIAAFYSPIARFWELLVGSGLACWPAQRGSASPPDSGLRHAASLLGLGLLVAAFAAIHRERAFPGWWAALPTFGAALLIWAGPRAWANRAVLSRSVLVWFGLISFPLYLWHWPLLAFPRLLEGTETTQWKRFVAVLMAILLAWVTYAWIEKPIRRDVRGRTIALRLIAFMSVVGAAGAAAYLTDGFGWRPFAPQVVNAGEIGPRDFFDYVAKHYVPCTPIDVREQAEDGSGYLRCPQTRQGAKNLALIGDSHAESLFPGLAERLADKNVVFYGNGEGLPFLSNPDYARIYDYVLADTNIRVVLIAAIWGRKLKPLAISDWRAELTKTVSRLALAGKQVYLVDDVPKFSFLPARCKYDGRFGLTNLCTDGDENFEATYDPVFKEIAASVVGTHVISVHGRFCKDGTCYMGQNGSLYFRDEHHLTIAGSMVAADAIKRQLFAP
jgi:peptidoglycan/LPS O-acetylase OafA/YrhL